MFPEFKMVWYPDGYGLNVGMRNRLVADEYAESIGNAQRQSVTPLTNLMLSRLPGRRKCGNALKAAVAQIRLRRANRRQIAFERS
jgi:hypothetical protein